MTEERDPGLEAHRKATREWRDGKIDGVTTVYDSSPGTLGPIKSVRTSKKGEEPEEVYNRDAEKTDKSS